MEFYIFTNRFGNLFKKWRCGMDKEFFIDRNRQVAKELYGDKIDKDRKVIGTNIWFDSFWRIHTN